MSLPVVIMAAGRGTRMKELSQHKPKHLVEINGRPFLAYLLDNLQAAGLDNIYLVIGYKYQKVYDWLSQTGNRYSLKVVNQFARLGEDKYGTLLPVLAVAEELANRPIIVLNGDDYYTIEALRLMAELDCPSAIAGVEHDNPERFGVLVADEAGNLKTIAEKSNQPPSRFINSGLYRFSSAIWNLLPQVRISSRGEYEITEAVKLLVDQEPVKIIQLKATDWLALNQPADVAAIKDLLDKIN